jgi:hypothetical protein
MILEALVSAAFIVLVVSTDKPIKKTKNKTNDMPLVFDFFLGLFLFFDFFLFFLNF